MHALVIIDMQVASFVGDDKHDVPGVVDRIKRLPAAVRRSRGHVIFVRHDGTEEEALTPHGAGWQVLPALAVTAVDRFLSKTLNDAFAATPLQDELLSLGAKKLGVAGWATDHCVDSTVRSAVSRGFEVMVPADAHTVSDRPHLSAPQIIEHHNRIWAGLIANPSVTVAPTQALIELAGS